VTPTDQGMAEIDMRTLPQLQASAPQPTAPPVSQQQTPPWKSVAEPMRAEELKDEIKY